LSKITIHVHPDAVAALSAASRHGTLHDGLARALALAFGEAADVSYAPLPLPDGGGCAMSARPGPQGTVVEIDAPGTMIPGRGLVRHLGGTVRRPAPR